MANLLRYRRSFCIYSIVLLAASVQPLTSHSNDVGIHLISAKNPGGLLEIKNKKITGVYPAFFSEASRRSGVPVKYRIVPWARAVKETESSDHLILFPFTRTEERENRFSWIAPLKENPICFVSGSAQINSLDEARKLKRVLVWLGSSKQEFLQSNGFNNLIAVGNVEKILKILKVSPNAAWYTFCNKARLFFQNDGSDISVKIGDPVANETDWLVSGKSFAPPNNLEKFISAIDALRAERLLEKLLTEVEDK